MIKKTAWILIFNHPMDRNERIKLCSLIISVGFFSSVAFHYILGIFYKQPYPFNSFLPSVAFGDFYGVYDQWNALKFTGTGYGLSYFPSTYLIIDLFVKLFSRFYVIIIYLSIFSVFFIPIKI